METNHFISTVRYEKTMDNGLIQLITEQYLIDALSFTEAETRTIKELTPYMSGEFSIPKIVKSRLTELFLSNETSSDKFYKAKVAFITIDELTGAEKKSNSTIIIQASDFKNAYDRFVENMKDSMSTFEIIALTETPIVDYYPFSNEE